jgi:uncharacterized DUF497 family protein
VFGDPLARIINDPIHSGDEERLVIFGLSSRSRVLAVMFSPRGERVRLISARRATKRENKQYEDQA